MEIPELTPNQMAALTREEADEVLERVKEIRSYLNDIELEIRKKFTPRVEKCGSCGASAGYIRIRRNGTYYCTRCGYSSGPPDAVVQV